MSATSDPSRPNAQSITSPSGDDGCTERGTTMGPATPTAPLWMWAAVGWSSPKPKMSQHSVLASDVGMTVAWALPAGSPGPGTSFSARRMAALAAPKSADSTIVACSHALAVTNGAHTPWVCEGSVPITAVIVGGGRLSPAASTTGTPRSAAGRPAAHEFG